MLTRARICCTTIRKKPVPNFKIVLNGIEIPRARHTKFLGVWLDDELKWDMHINKLVSKLKCGIGMLQCSKNLLSNKAKRLLYFGQIHSNLNYSICVWDSMLHSSMIQKLTKVENTAVKLIDPKVDVDELYRKHKILQFADMVRVEQCKMGYKLCHGLLPKALVVNRVKDHQNQNLVKSHKYPTWNKAIPNLPNGLGNKYMSGFLFNSIKLYSALDNRLKNLSKSVYLC